MKIFAVSLGCPKNRIDTEFALGALGVGSSSAHLVDNPQKADLLLVNTCGFIEKAVSESIETILGLVEKKGASQTLLVMGCMVQRYGEALRDELPEVDIFLGTGSAQSIRTVLGDAGARRQTPSVQTIAGAAQRFLTTPPWRAYLRISDGCSNRCTYCLIPRLRGRHRSIPLDDIITEAVSLAEKGVKEISLVGQDLTAYGDGENDLSVLLTALARETGIPWIRMLYLNPLRVNRRLLETIAQEPCICPYIDMPIQHASSRILRSMGRGHTRDDIEAVLKTIRETVPQATIRTTVMVGFPGETEEDFSLLKEFIAQYRFDHLGCFVYSDEEECPARKLPDKVDSRVGQDRMEQIMTLQTRIAREKNVLRVGRLEKVIIEGYSPETELLLTGRTRWQAPDDIDGIVYVNDGVADSGDIVTVEITDSHVYDLVGKIVDVD
jgi:ribosomal protein S12 methylthiotransferase